MQISKYYFFINCNTGQSFTMYHNWNIRWKYCCPGSEKYLKISYKRNNKKKSIHNLNFDAFPKSSIKGQELSSIYIFQKFINVPFLIGIVLLRWISMILHTLSWSYRLPKFSNIFAIKVFALITSKVLYGINSLYVRSNEIGTSNGDDSKLLYESTGECTE